MSANYSLLTARKEDIDAAKQISDTVNQLCLSLPWEQRRNSWIAFRLSDGRWDGSVYENRRDCVRHQANEFQSLYVSLRESMAGMDTNAAYVVLQYYRMAYDAGFRLPDPDAPQGGRHNLMPLPKEGIYSQIGQMLNASAKGLEHYIG